MTKRPVRVLAFTACLVLGGAPALAAGLFVIANPDVALSADDVKEVYLGEKQFAGPVRLVPVDNAMAQADFLKRAITIEAVKYSSTWTKKGFREGLNPPSIKSGDLEVIEFVKRTPGAVGYITVPPGSGVNLIVKY